MVDSTTVTDDDLNNVNVWNFNSFFLLFRVIHCVFAD